MEKEDRLTALRQQVAEKPRLETQLRELQEQRKEYDRRVVSLRVDCQAEQEDVEKLESRSLANYFFQVIGKLDDRLTKERKEAYAARVKLDGAQRELAAIDGEIQAIQEQLCEIRIAEADYQEALAKKRAALRTSGTGAGAQIMELEEKLAGLEARKREIREAIQAGSSAEATAQKILSELDSADGWNTWDMLGGGGILTHMAKHGHLDDAQSLVEELQGKLRRFKTELADIQIDSDLQVSIDGFLRFADYFFDGLFADWAVGDRIEQSQSAVRKTRSQIRQMMKQLAELEAATDREIQMVEAQLEELTVTAE